VKTKIEEKKKVTDALKTKSEERERTPKKSLLKLYLMAALVVAVVIMGVLYTLEKKDVLLPLFLAV